MRHDTDLERKLAILMSLPRMIVKDCRPARELLVRVDAPRLRHANDVGALRPLNIRPCDAAPMVARLADANPHDERMHYNCHYCPMRRDRSMPGRCSSRKSSSASFCAYAKGWCTGLFVTTGFRGGR